MFSRKLFFILALPFIVCTSCVKDIDQQAQYSQNDGLKAITRTIVTNLGTGFNSIFAQPEKDSLKQASIIQDFTHNARFLDDESGYIFAGTFSGFNISHPVNLNIEGTSTIGLVDAFGKEIVAEMINLAQYTGFGFLEYDYENPATGLVEKKTSFVKAIPEISWYVGAGFYHLDDEPFLTAQEINEQVVIQSVSVMAKGLGAIFENHISDSIQGVNWMRSFLGNIRFFDNQSGYFFVIDYSGYNVVQPPNPDFQGTYEWDFQDSKGNFLVQGLIETAQSGGGFYEYYWENYQTGAEERKKAFVKEIPGKDYLIGSGVYLK